METFETLQQVLNLGWPAIVMLAIWLLWLDYKRMMNNYISDLREMAGLRTSLANVTVKNPEKQSRPAPFTPGDT